MKNTYTIHPTLPDVYVVDISTRGHPGKEMLVCSIGLERLRAASGAGRWHYWPNHNGGPNSHGYGRAHRTVNGRRVWARAHRVIAAAPAGMQVSHLNHSPLDNRRDNLKLTSNRGNHAAYAVATIAASEVSRSGDKWKAQIRVGGRRHHLGVFDDYEDAAARWQAAHALCLAAELAGTPLSDEGFRDAFGLEPVRPYVRK